MIRVIFRNRKVAIYNNVTHFQTLDKTFSLRSGRGGEDVEAVIPIDVVERLEWLKPCKILKEKSLRELKQEGMLHENFCGYKTFRKKREGY